MENELTLSAIQKLLPESVPLPEGVFCNIYLSQQICILGMIRTILNNIRNVQSSVMIIYIRIITTVHMYCGLTSLITVYENLRHFFFLFH